MKTSSERRTIRFAAWLAIALLTLFIHPPQSASGNAYYALLSQPYAAVETPLVTLENGTDGTSILNANHTNARITIDATQSQLTYNYSLNVVSNNASSCEVRLEEFYNTDISRINATIILHDNSNSSQQITMSGGNLTQTNTYFDLASNGTIHVGVMDLIESSEGTTILNVYIRTRTLNTTTYTLYILTFEFT